MTARTFNIVILAAPLALLAACDDTPDTATAENPDEAAEVLEGTISDEMLPLDELRSEAPSEAEEGADGTDEGGDESGAGDASEDESAD